MIAEKINPMELFTTDSLIRNLQVMKLHLLKAKDSDAVAFYATRISDMKIELERRANITYNIPESDGN